MIEEKLSIPQGKPFKASFNLMDNFLLVIFFVFLPFNYALTFDIGFPLKVSEIVLFIYILIILLKFKFQIPGGKGFLISTLSIFILVAFISVIANFYYEYPYPLNNFNSRFGFKADSLLKFFYLVLAFIAFLVSHNAFFANRSKYLKSLFLGAIVASIYCWYLFLGSLLHFELYFLSGMDEYPQALFFSNFTMVRCGTMKEGNYMGLYLFLMGVLAHYNRNEKLSAFFFLTILTALSTMAILCATAFTIVTVVKKYIKHGHVKKLVNFLALMVLIFSLLLTIEEFRLITVGKIFVDKDLVHVDNTALSKADRINSINAAIDLGKDNLLLGVGLSNYALHYREYYPDQRFYIPGFKNIINNIYAEVFAEVGLTGLILFLIFLICLCFRTRYDQSGVILLGLLLTLIYLLTFPSFSMLYVWVFWGFISSLKYDILKREDVSVIQLDAKV